MNQAGICSGPGRNSGISNSLTGAKFDGFKENEGG